MSLPQILRDRILKQFDNLITEGEAIQKSMTLVPKQVWHEPQPWLKSLPPIRRETGGHYEYDSERMSEWHTRCISLLDHAIPKKSIHAAWVEKLNDLYSGSDLPKTVLPKLRAIRKDIETGLFDDLIQQLELAVASDYMSQAKTLMDNGVSGKFDHVPAAVLAGAVLERHLRELCIRDEIDTVDERGAPLMMDRLIAVLTKARKFESAQAQELRGWAAIRNKAAHGEFDGFSRQAVERMINGVQAFLKDYP